MLETAGDRTLRLNNKEAIFQTFWDCPVGDELAVLSQRSIDSDQQGVNKKFTTYPIQVEALMEPTKEPLG